MHAGLCANVHSNRCMKRGHTHTHTHTHTRSLYLVSCSQQVISHLVQVGGLACVDEAHHLFEDIWLHVIYLHTVLKREERTGEENTRRV